MVEVFHINAYAGGNHHVFNPESMTAWTATLKDIPDVHASAPSCPSIRDIQTHFFLDLIRLTKNNGQSSEVAVSIRPS